MLSFRGGQNSATHLPNICPHSLGGGRSRFKSDFELKSVLEVLAGIRALSLLVHPKSPVSSSSSWLVVYNGNSSEWCSMASKTSFMQLIHLPPPSLFLLLPLRSLQPWQPYTHFLRRTSIVPLFSPFSGRWMSWSLSYLSFL